jgi:hypothetical protein
MTTNFVQDLYAKSFGNNPYLQLLLDPKNGPPALIPDAAPTAHRYARRLNYSKVLMGYTDYLVHFTTFNDRAQISLYILAQTTDSCSNTGGAWPASLRPLQVAGDWIYAGTILPEEDLSVDYANARSVSQSYEIQSNTKSIGVVEMTGRITAVAVPQLFDFRTVKSTQFLKYRQDDNSLLTGTNLCDGIFGITEPIVTPMSAIGTSSTEAGGANYVITYVDNYTNDTIISTSIPFTIVPSDMPYKTITNTSCTYAFQCGVDFPFGFTGKTTVKVLWSQLSKLPGANVISMLRVYNHEGLNGVIGTTPIGHSRSFVESGSTSETLSEGYYEYSIVSKSPLLGVLVVISGLAQTAPLISGFVQVTLINTDVLRIGFTDPCTFVHIEDVDVAQRVSVDSVVNFEVIPTAAVQSIARDLKSLGSSVQYHVDDIKAAEMVFVNKKAFGLNLMGRMTHSQVLQRDSKAISDRNVLAGYASGGWGDITDLLKSAWLAAKPGLKQWAIEKIGSASGGAFKKAGFAAGKHSGPQGPQAIMDLSFLSTECQDGSEPTCAVGRFKKPRARKMKNQSWKRDIHATPLKQKQTAQRNEQSSFTLNSDFGGPILPNLLMSCIPLADADPEVLYAPYFHIVRTDSDDDVYQESKEAVWEPTTIPKRLGYASSRRAKMRFGADVEIKVPQVVEEYSEEREVPSPEERERETRSVDQFFLTGMVTPDKLTSRSFKFPFIYSSDPSGDGVADSSDVCVCYLTDKPVRGHAYSELIAPDDYNEEGFFVDAALRHTKGLDIMFNNQSDLLCVRFSYLTVVIPEGTVVAIMDSSWTMAAYCAIHDYPTTFAMSGIYADEDVFFVAVDGVELKLKACRRVGYGLLTGELDPNDTDSMLPAERHGALVEMNYRTCNSVASFEYELTCVAIIEAQIHATKGAPYVPMDKHVISQGPKLDHSKMLSNSVSARTELEAVFKAGKISRTFYDGLNNVLTRYDNLGKQAAQTLYNSTNENLPYSTREKSAENYRKFNASWEQAAIGFNTQVQSHAATRDGVGMLGTGEVAVNNNELKPAKKKTVHGEKKEDNAQKLYGLLLKSYNSNQNLTLPLKRVYKLAPHERIAYGKLIPEFSTSDDPKKFALSNAIQQMLQANNSKIAPPKDTAEWAKFHAKYAVADAIAGYKPEVTKGTDHMKERDPSSKSSKAKAKKMKNLGRSVLARNYDFAANDAEEEPIDLDLF